MILSLFKSGSHISTFCGLAVCCRPKNIGFVDCENVTVQRVMITESSDWTQLFRRCTNVLEDSVFVRGSTVCEMLNGHHPQSQFHFCFMCHCWGYWYSSGRFVLFSFCVVCAILLSHSQQKQQHVSTWKVWGNNDGLDVESGFNFTVSNSRFITGDDCLAFRSGHCNTLRTPWPVDPNTGTYSSPGSVIRANCRCSLLCQCTFRIVVVLVFTLPFHNTE